MIANALHVKRAALDFKAFSRDDIVLMVQALRKVDKTGFSAYVGDQSTDEQINDAIKQVRYCKMVSNGRKGTGGAGYEVLIDHDKLNKGDDQYPSKGIKYHLVCVKAYKRKDDSGDDWLHANIYDGSSQPVKRGVAVR